VSGPRDRDGFDERDPEGGWREPPHLRGDGDDVDRPNIADRRAPREEGESWTPPGWDLPPPERDEPGWRSDPAAGPASGDRGADVAPGTPPADEPPPAGPWTAPPRRQGAVSEVFAYQGDLVGAQAWAVQNGWTISDGDAPEDAPLRELIAAAPVRLSKDHRPAGVMRGRADGLDMVAFDVLYASGRTVVPEYAVTAVPLLAPVPYFRLSPARFWKHRTGGLIPVETGDPVFDSRWVLYTAEDWPGVRALAADPAVRGMLLNTDDGDEFWAAAGHVAAIRPDGHRPLLIEHHARLLTAVVRAVTAAT
jgi:hypothetical protein